MIQIKILCSSSYLSLEKEVNAYISENQLKVIDIKFTSVFENRYPNDSGKIYDTAMIIYKAKQ